MPYELARNRTRPVNDTGLQRSLTLAWTLLVKTGDPHSHRLFKGDFPKPGPRRGKPECEATSRRPDRLDGNGVGTLPSKSGPGETLGIAA